MTRRRWTWTWAAAILLAFSIPGPELPDVDIVGVDKLVHFGLFFVLAGLAAWPRPVYHPGTVLTAGAAYAVLTECYQWVMPLGRSFDGLDVVANLIGLLAGVGACLWRARRIRTGAPDSL